jgi:hypothetical protein
MSKPYTEQDLSRIFDDDLIWRRKELSDLKAAVRAADKFAKPALLRAIISMTYAHWEGYVRVCANRYFEFLTMRRKPYSDFERQIYVNGFLVRLDALHHGRVGLEAKTRLINEILDGTGGTFRYINPALIDTRSNLNTDVIREICLICAVDPAHFESERSFIDIFILKRRNAIAHGQQEFVGEDELDNLVANMLGLMQHFRTLLENKVYQKQYAA